MVYLAERRIKTASRDPHGEEVAMALIKESDLVLSFEQFDMRSYELLTSHLP
jgi:hypothetical protein